MSFMPGTTPEQIAAETVLTTPQVRQQQDPDKPRFGAVAVSSDSGWRVMNRTVHYWAQDAEVAAWAPLVAQP